MARFTWPAKMWTLTRAVGSWAAWAHIGMGLSSSGRHGISAEIILAALTLSGKVVPIPAGRHRMQCTCKCLYCFITNFAFGIVNKFCQRSDAESTERNWEQT